NAVEQTYQHARAVAGRDLQRVHAAGLALAARACTEDEVVGAGDDWLEQQRHELGTVAAVTVDEYDDGAVPRSTRTRCTGAAIAALPFDEYLRARIPRALDGAIIAAAVDDDDLIDCGARDGADHLPDRLFLVERRDHHRYARPAGERERIGGDLCG